MNAVINEFPDLPAVVTRIDLLVYEAGRTRSRKERRAKLKEAQRLADAFNEHCYEGGNPVKKLIKTLYDGKN